MTRWWDAQQTEGVSVSHRNELLETLRRVVKILTHTGDLELDLVGHLEKVPSPDRYIPNLEEVKEIAEVIRRGKGKTSQEAANMVEFLAFSGCSLKDTQALRWRHVGEEEIRAASGSVQIDTRLRKLLGEMERGRSDDLLFSVKLPKCSLGSAAKSLGLPPITLGALGRVSR